MITIVFVLYVCAVVTLALYGAVGLLTIWLYLRHRNDELPLPEEPTEWPSVTVQIPIYNERYVVEKLIDTAVSLDYPPDKLQIQILDDSNDDTTQKAVEMVNYYQSKGINIQLLHRQNREGYKAGALAQALLQASGEFIAIFDADFQPQPSFLRQTIPHFVDNAQLGMVQTRWGHLNVQTSPLTAAQSIALDKHFALEQVVRYRANMYPKFNGSGGVWRRSCIEDAGGWQTDTVCEDLCLSTRAILEGWQFRFLHDVVAPAELPVSINAYKTQQARWAKGSTQCLRKFGRAIWRDKQYSPLARCYALITMSAYNAHIFIILTLLLQLPLIIADYHPPAWLMIFSLFGMSQPVLFVTSQYVLYKDWPRRALFFPVLMLIALGMGPVIVRAIGQAFWGQSHSFDRTPKSGNGRIHWGYGLPKDRIVWVECFCMIYALVGIVIAAQYENWGAISFLFTCVLGYGYVLFLTLRERKWMRLQLNFKVERIDGRTHRVL